LPSSALDVCMQKNSDAINFYDFDQKTNTKKLLNKKEQGWKTQFRCALNTKKILDVTLNMPGIHNVQNAMAAIACADYYNIDPEIIKNSVAKFCGTKKRLTHIANFNSNKIIDDYAHHPNAIVATLDALSGITKNIIAIIEPHRYSRVKDFFKDYIDSFKAARHVILLEVFAAGEKNNGFDSAKLQKHAKMEGVDNILLCSQNNQEYLNNQIAQIDQKDGLIVFMGAGKISGIAAKFALFAKSSCKKKLD